MSYRTSILSPLPSYGLGTMPGGSTSYSSAYQRRSGSATRKFSSTYNGPSSSSSLYGGTSSSRPTSRPLPAGPGPLDHTGRKIGTYTSSHLSDIRKNSTGSVRGPVRADHSYQSSSKYDYTPSIGSLERKYSPSHAALNNTTKDTGSRSLRSRSVSNTDRITDNLSKIKLSSIDSVKASPRINDSDDSLYGSRESRKDRHEQNVNDANSSRVASRSRLSNGSVTNNDDLFTPRSRDSIGRATSIQRENENKRNESISDIGGSKTLSRQSSSSSISTVSISWEIMKYLFERFQGQYKGF